MGLTRVINTGATRFIGYLPPHGRSMSHGAQVTLDGDLRSVVVYRGKRYSQHTSLSALDTDLANGDIALADLDDSSESEGTSPPVSAGTAYIAQGTSLTATDLYTIDATTGQLLTDVGPVQVSGSDVALTGLAVDPTSGILYGATSNNSLTNKKTLVTINPATAVATVIGVLSTSSPDIIFDSTGQLYGSDGSAKRIYKIDKVTASRVVFVTASEIGFVNGMGLAVDSNDDLWITNGDKLYKYSGADGSFISQVTLSSSVLDVGGIAIGALKYACNGLLYGLGTGNNVSKFRIIDPLTGQITSLDFDYSNVNPLTHGRWNAMEFICP